MNNINNNLFEMKDSYVKTKASCNENKDSNTADIQMQMDGSKNEIRTNSQNSMEEIVASDHESREYYQRTSSDEFKEYIRP